jgi:hypothetical protein
MVAAGPYWFELPILAPGRIAADHFGLFLAWSGLFLTYFPA